MSLIKDASVLGMRESGRGEVFTPQWVKGNGPRVASQENYKGKGGRGKGGDGGLPKLQEETGERRRATERKNRDRNPDKRETGRRHVKQREMRMEPHF